MAAPLVDFTDALTAYLNGLDGTKWPLLNAEEGGVQVNPYGLEQSATQWPRLNLIPVAEELERRTSERNSEHGTGEVYFEVKTQATQPDEAIRSAWNIAEELRLVLNSNSAPGAMNVEGVHRGAVRMAKPEEQDSGVVITLTGMIHVTYSVDARR